MWRRILGALGVAVVVGAIAAGSGEAETGAVVPAEVASTRISTNRPHLPTARGHVFTFQVMIDACPVPLELDHTTLVERPPSPGARRGVAVITAFMREPQHETGGPCPPMPPLYKTIRVRTKRPTSGLIFFDGSGSPPRRVYPPLAR